ncbi:hypothetical protein C8Q78DRAFT_1146474 [Trametes maxima]|nr:hypothetical protein C8Q78DRAFT_1146474 [Trametes maxima]
MIDGFIDISTYKVKRKDPHLLKILFPASACPVTPPTATSTTTKTANSAAEHPLNSVTKTLLSWFSAYYTLDRLEWEAQAGTDTENPPPVSQNFSQNFRLMRAAIDARAKRAIKDSSPAAPQAAKTTVATGAALVDPAAQVDRAALAERASKLASHTALLALLEEVLDKGAWPLQDRVAESKPAKGWVSRTNNQVPKASFISSSHKRSLESVQEDLHSPSTKKSKA